MARETHDTLAQQFPGILQHFEAAELLRMAETIAPISAGTSHTKV